MVRLIGTSAESDRRLPVITWDWYQACLFPPLFFRTLPITGKGGTTKPEGGQVKLYFFKKKGGGRKRFMLRE